MTVVLADQKVKQALAMCHRAYVLEDGRIVMEGSGTKMPENQRAKEAFLGL